MSPIDRSTATLFDLNFAFRKYNSSITPAEVEAKLSEGIATKRKNLSGTTPELIEVANKMNQLYKDFYVKPWHSQEFSKIMVNIPNMFSDEMFIILFLISKEDFASHFGNLDNAKCNFNEKIRSIVPWFASLYFFFTNVPMKKETKEWLIQALRKVKLYEVRTEPVSFGVFGGIDDAPTETIHYGNRNWGRDLSKKLTNK